MIAIQEITALARKWKLLPTTVEKDYVLSWVLYGISQHTQLSQWLFKGGTCLKKCYFETHRFSEDLDFTVPENAIYTENEIRNALSEVVETVYEATGIDLQRKPIEVQKSHNKRNNETFCAKLTYKGPINLSSGNAQRIKFDISDDEIITDAGDIRNVFHPYSDSPDEIKIKCYSVNEILAEKTRAICERQGRARDIYDLVNIYRNFQDGVNIKAARKALKKKFDFIGIVNPTVKFILEKMDFELLKANWEAQLKHQVERLPPVESFLDDLKKTLLWLIEEKKQ